MALKGNAAAKAQQAYGQHRREEHDKSILLFDGLKTFKTGAHEQIAYRLEGLREEP